MSFYDEVYFSYLIVLCSLFPVVNIRPILLQCVALSPEIHQLILTLF